MKFMVEEDPKSFYKLAVNDFRKETQGL